MKPDQLLVVPPPMSVAATKLNATNPLPVYVRFSDLRAARIVLTRKHLGNLQKHHNFPTGIVVGLHARAWNVDEVMAWLKNRPTERKPMPENAHRPAKKKKQNADLGI